MRPRISLIVIFGLMLAVSVIADESIYRWTDAQGVVRYSNDPPPEGVTHFEKVTPAPDTEHKPDVGAERRSSYDTMVDDASRESGQLEEERKRQEADRAEKKKRLAEEQRRQTIEAERSRLEAQIEAIKQRAISPTYPPGMKQAQIDQLQKQIDALDKTP